MFVEDLFVMIHAHWSLDESALWGRMRVQQSLVFILCAATASRPGAILVSGSATDTGKALLYEHIEIMRIRHVQNPNRTTTVALVTLVNVKTSGGKGRR